MNTIPWKEEKEKEALRIHGESRVARRLLGLLERSSAIVAISSLPRLCSVSLQREKTASLQVRDRASSIRIQYGWTSLVNERITATAVELYPRARARSYFPSGSLAETLLVIDISSSAAFIHVFTVRRLHVRFRFLVAGSR